MSTTFGRPPSTSYASRVRNGPRKAVAGPSENVDMSDLGIPGAGVGGYGMGIPRPGTGVNRPGTGFNRPGTAMLPPGTGMARPGTGMNRPGTGMARPGTGMNRPGTGMARPGTGMNRPGTGMTGGFGRPGTGLQRPGTALRPGTAMLRPGTAFQTQRLVQDSNYWMAEYRNAILNITAEIKFMEKQINEQARGADIVYGYETRSDEIAAELSGLQDTLADLNTVMDQVHTNQDVSKTEQETKIISARVGIINDELESISATKRRKESSLKTENNAIEMELQQIEKRIEELPLDLRDTYHKQKTDNLTALAAIAALHPNIDNISKKIKIMEDAIAKDVAQSRLLKTFDRQVTLAARKKQLLLDTQDSGDTEASLLQSVRENNQEIAGLERQMVEIEENLNRCNEEILLLDQSNLSAAKVSQFDLLIEKRTEMSTFIDSFPATKNDLSEAKNSLENDIERMMPKFQEAHRELERKKAAGEQPNQQTNVFDERNKKRADLERVNQLDGKMTVEISQLSAKLTDIRKQIDGISNIKESRDRAVQERALNAKKLDALHRHRTQLTSDLVSLQQKVESKQSEFEGNETAVQLGALEGRLKQLEEINANLMEYIGNAGGNEEMESEVVLLIGTVNSQVLKILAGTPLR